MAKKSNGPAMDYTVFDDVSTVAKIIGTFQTSDEEEIKEKRFLAIKRNAEVLRGMAEDEDDDRMENTRKKLFEQTTLASESLGMAETRLELLWDHMKLMTKAHNNLDLVWPDHMNEFHTGKLIVLHYDLLASLTVTRETRDRGETPGG
ncbi:hypothetical protein EJB05_06652, partial [Eragrostis curvula]